MKKLESFIGPGTAGIAQRISSNKNLEDDSKSSEEKLYIVGYNKLLTCTQNQY
ncbi:MAG: hypothetical protein ABIG37_02575 [Nanoarchaeota archaeon]|nr:hypothetical protein [Nanoarchaeota archaeon]